MLESGWLCSSLFDYARVLCATLFKELLGIPTTAACRARLSLVSVGGKLRDETRGMTISKIQDIGEVTDLSSTSMFVVYLSGSKS